MRSDMYDKFCSKVVKLCTFYIAGHKFGIDILKVQEINKNRIITTVPGAQEFIIGIMNLRGQIVTVIDLGKKIGLSFPAKEKESNTIIVNSHDEYIGLLVGKMGDVIPVKAEKVAPPPVNIKGVLRSFIEGVLETDTDMIGILDVEKLLA
jgi:purine-binding chemotaxis protein CheW